MKAEVEGILLWAFEGLQRLTANNFKFTDSDRTRENREQSNGTTTMFMIFWILNGVCSPES